MSLPYLFVVKKNLCMLFAGVEVVGFILLAIFSHKFSEKLAEDSDWMTDDLSGFKAKMLTAMLIFTIGGAVLHFLSVIGIFFEHLYITAVVALLELVTMIGAILEAVLLPLSIFWASFGVSLFLLALLALHLFDLVTIYNGTGDYNKPTHSPATARIDEDDDDDQTYAS